MAERLLRRVEDALVAVSAAALLVMMVLMVAEVALRYVFAAPLTWSVGFVSGYLLVGFFFLGLPYTVREGAHISIDLVHDRLPARGQRACTRAALLLGAVLFAALTYGGVLLTADAVAGGDVPPPGSAELPWPVWTSTVMVPLGCAVVVLRLLLTLVSPSPGGPAAPAGPESSPTAAEVR